MIHLISLISLILIIAGASFTILSTKKNLNLELKDCVSLTTEFNLNRKTTLERLFYLNSTAKQLRNSREAAERAYQTAPAQAKAAAYAALQAVKIAQKLFRASQQKIILTLQAHTYQFKAKVISSRKRILIRPNNSLIESYPSNSDSPSYQTISNFDELSKTLIRSEFKLNNGFPKYFKKLLKNNKGVIECGTNIIVLERQELQLKLLGGKSF